MKAMIFPQDAGARKPLVDVLRGFALVGVTLANFNSYVEQQVPESILKDLNGPFGMALTGFNTIFLEWKFMTLFSILFGYGFGLILQSLERKGIAAGPFFRRRMAWLFVFGVVHALFWTGDVLHLYAISGVLLVPFRKLSPRNLGFAALLFMFAIPTLIGFLYRHAPDGFGPAELERAYSSLKTGELMDVFRVNIWSYERMFLHSGGDLHDISETLGRFLLGFGLMRTRVLDEWPARLGEVRRAMLLLALPAVAYLFARYLAWKGAIDLSAYYWDPIVKAGILSVAALYAGIVIHLFIRRPGAGVFLFLRDMGRMTLTNYLMVSVVNIILWYGIGFGLLGAWGQPLVWACALAWLAVEAIISRWWAAYFRYGPMEWIWRQLTYRRRLPLRRTDGTAGQNI